MAKGKKRKSDGAVVIDLTLDDEPGQSTSGGGTPSKSTPKNKKKKTSVTPRGQRRQAPPPPPTISLPATPAPFEVHSKQTTQPFAAVERRICGGADTSWLPQYAFPSDLTFAKDPRLTYYSGSQNPCALPREDIYPCTDAYMMVVLIFPGSRYLMYGSARVALLAGKLTINGFAMKAGAFDPNKLQHLVAPYAMNKPATVEAPLHRIDTVMVEYKHNRLRSYLKQICHQYERIMQRIGEQRPAVLIVDRRPRRRLQVIENLHMDLVLPCELHSSLMCDRSWFFANDRDFAQLNPESSKSLATILENINAKRIEGERCFVVPLGEKNVGKSSFVRYFINLAMSNSNLPVYLLDGDIGQTEFTPAGIMSLWKMTNPVLGVPFSHQKKVFECSFFFGAISPADDEERYKNIFDRLHTEFMTNSEPGSLLVMNTMGWLEEVGKIVLDHIFAVARPFVAFNLQKDRTFTIPKEVPNIVRILPKNTPGLYQARDNLPPVHRYSPAIFRELSMIAYFTPLMPRPTIESVNETKPYSIRFSDIELAAPEDYSCVNDRYYFAMMNCQIVALCYFDEMQQEAVDLLESSDGYARHRLMNDPTMPFVHRMTTSTPLMKCVGYGIVRAIDIERRMLFLTTPVPIADMERVKILARGYDMHIPSAFLTAQSRSSRPYTTKKITKNKGLSREDMFGSLTNVVHVPKAAFPTAHSR